MVEMQSKRKKHKDITSFVSPLAEPIAEDEWLLATYGRTFHFAARFFPPTRRRDVVILYAFFRILDDLVDEPSPDMPQEAIRKELLLWNDWFRDDFSLPAPREPLGAQLAAVLLEHRVPTSIFLDFLAGLAFDLEPEPIRNFMEMQRYCYLVAGTVGIAMAHVLGTTSAQGLLAARNLGIAMQLTNILRDVGDDLTKGRIYLPQDEMERFVCPPARLEHLQREQRGPDEHFRALMRYQVNRAHHYYRSGLPGTWLLPADCRLPVLIAGRLYRYILTVIERKNYDVLRSRAATNVAEKAREAAIACVLHRFWRYGEELTETNMEVILENCLED